MAQKPVAKKSAKKSAPGPAAKRGAGSKTNAAKKTTAKKTAAKKTAKKVPRPDKAAAAKGIAVLVKAQAARRRTKDLPPAVWSPGQLAVNANGVVGVQLAGRFVTLEEVAAAGQLVGLVFPLQPQASGALGAMIDKLLAYIREHANGTIVGGVTTCFTTP